MTKNTPHLTDETLVALISKTLSEVKEKKVKEHLDSCAECMLNYSEMSIDLKEMESLEVESVPQEILDSLGLAKEKVSVSNFLKGFLNTADQFIDWLISPPAAKIRLATVSLAVLLITFVGLKLFTGDKAIELTPDMFGSHELEFTSDDGLKLLSIHFSQDSIKIFQRIGLQRRIKLSNTNGDVLFDETFESTKYTRSLKSIQFDDSIHFQMYTNGEITVDSLFVMHSE